MNLEWMDKFNDRYLKEDTGRGVFLCGVTLGFIASCQRKKGSSINDAPLFKKLPFGKLQLRDLKRHMAEVPTALKAYDIPYQRQIRELSSTAGEMILSGKKDMGVDGNFIFSTAFLNAWKFMYQIFDIQTNNENDQKEENDEL